MTNVENIYKLSPLQSGMLFHVLYDSADDNPYVAQSVDEFVGVLDAERLREAWQAVVDRHAALRSAFVWEGLDEPVQVVQRRVELPFVELDWRADSGVEQERRLKGLLDEDRVRGFDLGSAPLLRLTVVRLADDRTVSLWSFHHLLLDGWSTQMVQKEVFALYRAGAEGSVARLSDPVPYARYIEWLGEQSREKAEKFWRGYLGSFGEPTELGITAPTGRTGFDNVRIKLDAEAAARLNDFARTHRLTANTVVQGAWALLLSRYSGSDDVVFGSTVAGRSTELADSESIVGLFINTLPVRARISAERPVVEWLREMQEQQVEVRQYEYTSLVDAQGWSAVPRGEKLFQSIFVFENYPKVIDDASLPRNLSVHNRMGVARTGYPLTIAVEHTADRLLADITYDQGLFDRGSVERLAGHFGALLSSVVSAGAGGRVGELDLLTEDERRRLLVEWNDTAADIADATTLHELFEARVRERPDAVALVFGDQTLSYAQLNARANQLAHHLKTLGVGAGALVGVCLERGLDMVTALLGVLKAGGAYVPLDPAYPTDRLAFMLQDTTATAVITHAHLHTKLPAPDNCPVVCLDRDTDTLAALPTTNPAPDAGPDDLAYVIYTSGSTGTPKGVLVEHRSVANRLLGVHDNFHFGPDDAWTLFHSYAFDFSVWEIWGALTHGARLVIVDHETTRNTDAFIQLLINEHITVLNQTPSAFNLLQQQTNTHHAHQLSLRLIIFGGEALQPARLKPWWKTVGDNGPRLVNMYGITETTIHATTRNITPTDSETTTTSPIGHPLPHTEIFVLDPTGNPTPIGIPGELWISGTGLARGYLNRPELTDQHFTERKINGHTRRLYRSGDTARWLPQGELEYLGRLDNQVKIRGHRIELGEIEATLTHNKTLKTTTLTTHEDTPGNKRLIAYAVPTPGTQPTTTELHEWCRHHLPTHMIPSTFILLDTLPLTPNGKIDHKALPTPDNHRPHTHTPYTPPRTQPEEAITRIWAEVLRLDQVGIHDNFFELGGDSILSIQVISRAKRYGLHLTPRMIFQHQTIAGITEHEQQALPRSEDVEPASSTRPVPTTYGLAPLQSGMLFHSLYDASHVNPYTVQFLDEFVGALDVDRLREAWQAVVDRHAALRSAFVWEGLDEPVQVVQRRVELPFVELDWRADSGAEQERRLEELLDEDRDRGFDLGSAPLLRLTVVRLADDRIMCLWTFHHLILDGWSAQLAMKEVFALYRAEAEGSVARLSDPVPYARYIEWLGEQSREKAEKFWRGYLGSFGEPTELGITAPTGRTGFDDVVFHLDAGTSSALKDFARTHRLTANTVVQGAWALLLSRYSGSSDVVYGSIVSGRHDGLPEAESMIGLFINTLPVRARVSAEQPVVEWLREVQEQQVEVRQYEYTSLVDAQGWSAVPKGDKLFQSILVFQNFPGLGDDELPKGLTRHSCLDVERTGYPITAIVYDGDRIKINLAYDRGLFDRGSVERLAGHFGALLSSVVSAGAGGRVGELDLLTEDERRRLLVEWNDTAADIADATTLHELFEARVRERPDAVALVFGNQSLSYAQLNARANQLAHHLKTLGVGAGALVGVCLERGLDMVTALLGVLKAGGAYVPLDPAYPTDRLAFMLQDTTATAVITHAHLHTKLPAPDNCPVVCLDRDTDTLAALPTTNPAPDAGPDDLAYVIYTSGSTGTPKGVLVEHRSVANRLLGVHDNFHFGPDDAWTLFHSYAFDFSVWEIWGALTHGARLVIVDHETTRNTDAFIQLLINEHITVLNQTPSAFNLLQQQTNTHHAHQLSLRLIIFGGEALQPARLKPWWKTVGDNGPRLVNMYGITETTIHATTRNITPTDSETTTTSPIGHPLPHTEIFVLDPTGNPTPIGIPGELWISGTGLARGYLNRPELTDQHFTERKINGHTRRLYRSGDTARWLPQGELEYLGRLDNQVKIRGHRIELGEIEATLTHNKTLKTTTLTTHEDTPGNKRLIAYAVPTPGTQPTTTELHEWCRHHLPTHMIPSTFILLDTLPLTPNGKIDHKALPTPDNHRPHTHTPYTPPRTQPEEAITRIWAEVLRLDQVGIHDNFFELGGDSILSIQVISRAKRYGLHLTPRMIFQHQTIAEIAARAEERSTIWAEQGPVQGEAHVTPIQRWFFDLELPDPGLFNQSRLLETQGLEPTTLAKALAVLVEHHDALRLRFEHGAEGWTQTHAAYEDSGLCAHFDLSGVPDGEVRARMEGGADEVQHGMDLTNGPLLRAALFDLGGARGQRLLLTVHHLVVDAVSWHILLEDLGSAYESLAAGEPAVLPMKTTSYQAWSARLRHHASTAEAHSPLAYWTRPRTAAAVPRDRDGDNTNVSYDSVTVALDTEETASLLREVPRTFDVRINDVLLTAVARAVSAWTESPSVLVALEGHGREDLFPDVDLSRTVGWFTSIFPVELHTDPQDDVTASLLRVRDQLAEVPDRGVGYGILRYCGDADVQERLRSLPRPEISFNYLGQFESAVPGLGRFAGADEPMGQAESPAGRRAHLIDILASVQSGSLSVTVSFSRNIHEKRTAETLAARLGSVLRDVLRAGREQAGPGGERAAERESYELTPLQAGMLFHSLSDPLDTSEVRPYVVQFADEFIGPLDTDLFRSAWQRVVDRHTILRSGFGTDSDGTPVQVVQPEAELRFDELDWRSAGAEEQGALLKRLLVDDRNRGFDLEAAPLMRFTLARTADDRVLVLWSFHHLLLDGWSAQLVQHEFYTLYRSSLAREEDALAAPVPYSRYIEWLQAQSAAEAEAYWRRRLSGFQAPTGLGVDRDTGDTGFGDLTFALDTVQFSRVRRFARTHRLTVNTVVQGLWALLLSRYSGSDDVLFGATVSGRPADLPDMERMVGPFINTLPVRVEVPADAQVADWLKQVQDQHVELRGYEYSSLADVQGWSDVPRSEQLFRSILVFENYPQLLDGAELPDGLERKFLLYVERTGYPLVLGAAETGDELSFHLVYDRSLFDAATADRMAGHLTTLLAGMLDDPAGALSGLGMLSAAELRQFAEWNDTAMDHPHDRTVHELIEERAALAPDAIAVSFGDASLTYGELNVRANRLAHHLRRKGVRPGVLVGLCVERGLDMIVALLGVLKSGGAYVPLDRGYPAERLDFMIKDTGTPVIVTQGHLVGRLPAHDCETILLDEHRDGSDTREAADPEPLAGPEDLAYVIYTSGSTGTPKGVMIEHRSMSDRMQEMRRQYGLTAEDTYLQFSSVTFDGSVGEIFPTLVAGAELVLRGDDWNPAWILETLHNKEVTVCQLPPFVWNELTAQITSSADLGPRLRLMSMGGEKVLAASVDRWFQHTSIPLFNIYGPTEATVNMTTCLITGPSAIVSIGGPVANAQALVVDEHGRQVPVGVPGELWIGGNIGLSRGYLNRPELTAEKFVRHPLSDDPRSRAYRTGDLVRRLPDGTLDILGRMDDQVKLRGFRIELGEVESTLLSHPDVGACVVVLVEDGPEGKRLVAYCVPAPGKQPGVSDLREWCVRGLPDYMVPSAFVLLDVLPSTANGKAVDRKALPAPDGARPAIATAFAAPRPGTEERLAEIWRDVLALDQVGRHDNFFELGGNSFLSVQVIGRARKNRIRLTPRVIFQNPTLAELAAHLDGGGPAAGTGRSGAAAARAEQPRPVRPASGRFAVVGAVEGQEDSRVAVVRLNESAAERVVFCFHEGGGNVSGYVHLADALSPVARVIGIEARSVAFDAEPEDDVAAMARSYWRAMREMQPSGPYVLAGWSFGGALAIEIASLVAGAGERVGLLVALDSCLPVSGARGMIEADHEALVRLLAHVGTGGAPTGGPETSAEVDALMRALNLPADVLSLPRGELVRHLRTMEAHTRAVLHHRPPVVDCPVLLYQAAESPWVLPLAESWQPFADRVDARVVPGGHLSFLLAPHVEALAAEIAAALRELDD